MDTQNLVKPILGLHEALQWVGGLLFAKTRLSRAEISRRMPGALR